MFVSVTGWVAEVLELGLSTRAWEGLRKAKTHQDEAWEHVRSGDVHHRQQLEICAEPEPGREARPHKSR